MKTNLSHKQFANFIAYLWNNEYFLKWEYDLWAGIMEKESSRKFEEGYNNFCQSELTISPRSGMNWTYTTTSGTILRVFQSRWEDDDDFPLIEVEIPENRAFPGRTHFEYLRAVRNDIPYRSWKNYYYQMDESSLKVHLHWCNGDVEKVITEKTQALEERLRSLVAD